MNGQIPECYRQLDQWFDTVILKIKKNDLTLNGLHRLAIDGHRQPVRYQTLLSIVDDLMAGIKIRVQNGDNNVLPDLERISVIIKWEIKNYNKN